MLLSELISRCRIEAFDNSTPPLFSDDELAMWLNEAQVEACIRKQLIRENSSIPLTQFDIVPNVREYPLDPRMFEIVYASLIWWNAVGMLPWPLGITTDAEMDTYRPFWRTLPCRPMAIIQRDTLLGIDCIPNAQYQINVEGWRLPMWQMGIDAQFTGSVATTVLTVTDVQSGKILQGATLQGIGVMTGTTVGVQTSGITGGVGTYTVNNSQTVASTALTSSGVIPEVLADGTLTLTAGSSGQVSSVLVNGNDILGGAVAFVTDLPTTAAAVVAQITANTKRYTASSLGAVITITDLSGTGQMHNGYTVSAVTTGITTTSTAFSGGIDAVVNTPEINSIHHRHLVKWALHRAYEKPDAETMNPDKSEKALAQFVEYFGDRPDASNRKRLNASNPHRNRVS